MSLLAMSSHSHLVGSVIDAKYRVERLLGGGAMGEVYAGSHIRLDRPVAIKLLRAELSTDQSLALRFSREARAAAKLEHPNAVAVYDFGSLEDGTAYLVMEYIDGVSLRELMRQEGPSTPERAVSLIRQAAAAVGAAHAQGIVHRDIKPDNMMVRVDDAGEPTLKVVDFGLAKILEGGTQLTSAGDWLGTPKYMAPEQVSSDTVDARADVYALGCVLFELLAGRPPFIGTATEVAFKHAVQPVPTFASLGVAAPAGLEEVVRRTLEKDPNERTASAADLLDELDRVDVSAAPRATPESPLSTTVGVRLAPTPEESRDAALRTRFDAAGSASYSSSSHETRVRATAARPASARIRATVDFPEPAGAVARHAPRTGLVAGIAVAILFVAIAAYVYLTMGAPAATADAAPPATTEPAAAAPSVQPAGNSGVDTSGPVFPVASRPQEPTPVISVAPQASETAPEPTAKKEDQPDPSTSRRPSNEVRPQPAAGPPPGYPPPGYGPPPPPPRRGDDRRPPPRPRPDGPSEPQ